MGHVKTTATGVFVSDSEMSRHMRELDWTASILGKPALWPSELRAAIGIILCAPTALAIYWGKDHILFYNDAWRDLVGAKHPAALGQPAREVFPEIWGQVGPAFSRLLNGLCPTSIDDLPFDGDREPKDSWPGGAFSAIPLEDGTAGGILNNVNQPTNTVAGGQLPASENERLEQMFVQAPGFMAMLAGPEHRFVLANPAYEQLVGNRKVLGKTVAEALPDVVRQGYVGLLDKVYQSGKALVASGAKYAMQADPNAVISERCVDFVFQPVVDSGGKVIGIFMEGTDVTERYSAAAALRESQERLARVLDQVPVGVGMFDTQGRLTLKNPRLRELIGGWIPSHDAGKGYLWDGFDAAGALLERENYPGARVLRGEDASSPVDFRQVVDGMERWFHVSAVPVKEDGAIVGGVVVVQDVTEAARIRRQLRESEARQAFRAKLSEALRPLIRPSKIEAETIRLLGEYLGASHVHYVEVESNDAHVVLSGDRHGSGVPDWAERYSLDDFPALVSECRAARTFVVTDVATDSRLSEREKAIYASLSVSSVVDVPLVKEGRLLGLLTAHRKARHNWTTADIALIEETAERTWEAIERARSETRQQELHDTLERRVAEALAERQLLVEVFEATGAFIQVVDRDFTLLAINKANAEQYKRIYGIRVAAGDNLLDILADFPEQREAACAHFERAFAGETFTVTGEFGSAEYGARWYEIMFSPLRVADGQASAAYHFSFDITERRQEQERLREAEEQLRQSQKMDAMGQLTGGVAHDFNNLLSPIVGSLDLLQRKGLGGEREQRLIDGALQSAERARVLVQRLLAFARRQPLQPERVDIGSLVAGMASLITSTTGPQIKVVTHVAEQLPAAVADANQIEMAILNLAVNARDAMPEGGTLRMTTYSESIGDNHPSKLPPGRYVCLSVADTGIGMDEVTAQRAIEPFFSTKGVGRGTGLGLSMVHGLASQLGGTLMIHSALDFGTNIEVWLPASAERASEASAAQEDVTFVKTAGTVLLVDDEELVRASTAALLLELGYAVTEAGSAEEALNLAEGGMKPDVLITDYLMPGMNGNDLACKLQERWRSLRVLIVSGYTDADGVDPRWARLLKPFRYTDLTAKLREMSVVSSRVVQAPPAVRI